MADIEYHAALTAKLIDAIKSIPVPEPPEWTNGDINWRFINGVLCSKIRGHLKWRESIYYSIEELRNEPQLGQITLVTK